LLEAVNVTKYYNSLCALKDVSFRIEEGEIVSFLGPNGAGKSTLFHILVGLLRNYTGDVFYKSRKVFPFKDRGYRSIVGFVPQATFLERELTVEENLRIGALLYGVKNHREVVDSFLRRFDLFELKDRKVEHLSGGMKRKVVIVKSMLHRPRLLFLDEPTTGLDVNVRHDIWNLLIRISKEESVTVVISTHYMEEAESLSDRVFIMNRGSIVVDGRPEELKSLVGRYVVEESTAKGMIRRYFDSKDDAIRFMNDRGMEASTIRLREVSLEDVFIKVTGENERDSSNLL
jgi:ABC-2 type transport system ATP-binding protein